MERRLAAIMATDVVGYSRLMELDEAGTLTALKAHREELIDPIITEHRGRIVKLMGDGALVEFASVVDAVECAVAIQQAMAERTAGSSEKNPIEFRIGVNLGDVIVEGDDIYGDGVNLAARLEGLAEPGGICISDKVHSEIRAKLDATFADGGEEVVKNITEPVRVWRWARMRATSRAGSRSAEPGSRMTERPTIAVLPFDDLSRDPEGETFADGLTEDIITSLSRTRWYQVTARNSTFAYKGRSPDIRQVAEELGARYVLEGSVRKAGDRIRITAQLIDAKTGNHVWADRFDRILDDVFALQDEIAHRVSSILIETIWQDVAQQVAKLSPEEYGPYEHAYRATELLHRLTPRDVAEATDGYLKAIELGPELSLPHLGLGCCYFGAWLFWGDPAETALERLYHHAAKLHEMAPDDAQTYRLLSRVSMTKGEFAEAKRHNDRALKLNPNDGDIVVTQGIYYTFSGEPEEALPWFAQALDLHSETPHSADIFRAWLSIAQFVKGDYGDAVATLKEIGGMALIRNLMRAACHARLEEMADARASAQAVLAELPAFRVSGIGLWRVFRREQDGECLRRALLDAGLPD